MVDDPNPPIPPINVVLRLGTDDFEVRVQELRDSIDDLIETARKYDHQAFLSIYPAILNLVKCYKEMNKAPIVIDGE
jgi:G:T/U-mismatch repair DNA glycosylase